MSTGNKKLEDQDMDRYTVISADCHAGAAPSDYRPYLESRLHEEFDQWLAGYTNPFRDLTAPEANRNWDNPVRQSALEADGIVGEVVYRIRVRAAPGRSQGPQSLVVRLVR
jgi:hypothetical protein